MVRTTCCEKTGLKRGAWTPEEDRKLSSYIKRYGHWNWRELPKYAGLQRCGKSCRLRWVNYLKPDIKRGSYTKEEEEIIINLHETLGNRWSTIAAKLPGRTDNEIKNYWHTHLKKRSKRNSKALDEKKSQNQRETSTKNKTEAADHHQSIINSTTCFSSNDMNIAAKPTVLESSSVVSSTTTPNKISCTDIISTLKTDSSDDDLKSSEKELDGNYKNYSSEILADQFSTNGSFWTEPFLVAEDFASSTLICDQQFVFGVCDHQESSSLGSSYELYSDDSMDFWFNNLSLEGEMQGMWVQPWASTSEILQEEY